MGCKRLLSFFLALIDICTTAANTANPSIRTVLGEAAALEQEPKVVLIFGDSIDEFMIKGACYQKSEFTNVSDCPNLQTWCQAPNDFSDDGWGLGRGSWHVADYNDYRVANVWFFGVKPTGPYTSNVDSRNCDEIPMDTKDRIPAAAELFREKVGEPAVVVINAMLWDIRREMEKVHVSENDLNPEDPDWNTTHVDQFFANLRGETVQKEWIFNANALIDQVRGLFPDASMIWHTPPKPRQQHNAWNFWKLADQWEVMNGYAKTLMKAKSVSFVDGGECFPPECDECFFDMRHPNGHGGTLLLSCILKKSEEYY